MGYFDDKDQFLDAFSYITKKYGERILYSPDQLKNLLYDLLPNFDKQIRIFLSVVQDSKIVRLVLTDPNVSFEQVTKRIRDDMGLSVSWSRESAAMLFAFLGRESKINITAITSDAETQINVTDEKFKSISTSVCESNNNKTVEPLLKRAFMFLEDGDFSKADIYCEKVLDLDPECMKAYLGKFMVENSIKTESEIAFLPKIYDTSSQNLKKALAFATPEDCARINDAIIQAKQLYDKTFNHLESPQKSFNLLSRRISCGERHTSILLLDGRVVGTGEKNNHKLYNFSPINNASMLAHEFNSRDNPFINYFTYLTTSGEVMEMCENVWRDGKIRCYKPLNYNWINIKKVVCQYHHTVALINNGKVIATGDNDDLSCEISSWSDIVDISCGDHHTVGLKKDGTVIACGAKSYYDKKHIFLEVKANSGQCDIEKWKDIASICCSGQTTYGVKKDGTVCLAGDALIDRFGQAECLKWTDIIGISASQNHVVGVKNDGTVVACGKNDCGQCNVSDWTDVVVVACGYNHTVGIRSDGMILAVGSNYDKQCDISKYKFFFDQNEEKEYYNSLYSKRRSERLCQHCGGKFKGLFNPKCTYCGQEKDY